MNRYDPARAYMARQKRTHELHGVSIRSFRSGIRAAATAARQLIAEGFANAENFEVLVYNRVIENRKCNSEKQSQPEQV